MWWSKRPAPLPWWSKRPAPLSGRLKRLLPARRWAVLAAVLALSACGFHPLYQSRGDAASPIAKEFASIRINGIADRDGQILRNLLLERLNPDGEPLHPRYVLSVHLTRQMSGIAYQKDATASGGELTLTAVYTLRDTANNATYGGSAASVISVNYLGARYASVAAERDAENQALTQLADSLQDRLATYLYHGAVTRPDGPQ